MESFSFTVLGRPQPAGSKRAFGIRKGGVPTGRIAVVDDNPAAKSWQQEVATTARSAFRYARGIERDAEFDPAPDLLAEPISVDFRFYFRRPAAHYGTGRNAGKLKPQAPEYPMVRPDTTKLIRAVEDALTGCVWRDDSIVVSQVAGKFYGEPERCVVTIYPLR